MPNPIVSKRADVPLLQFSRSMGLECVQCHKFIAVAWKGKSNAQLDEELKNEENYRLYMQGLHRYAEAVNNSTNGRAPRCGIVPLTFVSTVEEAGFACEENLGVLVARCGL